MKQVPYAGALPSLDDIRATYSAIGIAFDNVHDLHRWLLPSEHHSHCRTCHPEMAWMPCAIRINGREYHRRQKARKRRRRKGRSGS